MEKPRSLTAVGSGFGGKKKTCCVLLPRRPRVHPEDVCVQSDCEHQQPYSQPRAGVTLAGNTAVRRGVC